MDANRLGLGQRIATAAAVLLLIDMFLTWYSVDVPDGKEKEAEAADALGLINHDAWASFGLIDLVLLLLILVVLAAAVIRVTNVRVSLPVNPWVVAAGLGALATILVLFRVISIPEIGVSFGGNNETIESDELSLSFAAILGLLLTAAVTYGAFRAMGEGGETTTAATRAPATPAAPPATPDETRPPDAPPPAV